MDSSLLKLADKKDIPEGKAIIVAIPNGRELAIFNSKGHFYALDNSCPHMGGPLGEGEMENNIVTCPWHGWQFDICTGMCQNMPGEDVVTFNLEIIGEEIFIRC